MVMRNSLYIIALTGAICCVGSAVADDATSALAVKGKIVPGSCTPTLSNGGKVDYGTIQTTSLFRPSNSLGVKNITLSISCNDKAYVGFTATDNRRGSVAENIEVANSFSAKTTVSNNTSYTSYLFGLGTTLEDKPVGAFTIGIDVNNVSLDGASLQNKTLYYSLDNVAWSASYTGGIYPYTSEFPAVQGFRTSSVSTPQAFKEAEIPLIISAAIVDARELSVTDKVTLDGNVTFSIIYL